MHNIEYINGLYFMKFKKKKNMTLTRTWRRTCEHTYSYVIVRKYVTASTSSEPKCIDIILYVFTIIVYCMYDVRGTMTIYY